jgi:adenine-specific DNA-methyltransferase
MAAEQMTEVTRPTSAEEVDVSKEKLKALLKKQFQLDSPDIDFGIYRIINFRRRAIEDFIDRDLIEAVDKEFQKYRTQTMSELREKVEAKKKEIQGLEKQFGETILRDGDIEEKFRDKPFAKEYLELKKQLDDAEVTESIENQVFNDLVTFFSRYYQDGDFIPKRRYSSKHFRYAIPYNGDEVKLHWANFNEYYVKTADIFKDYEFVANGWRIILRTVIPEAAATTTARAERRYFALRSKDSVEISPADKTCILTFEYKQLTDDELRHLLSKKKTEEVRGIKQDNLNAVIMQQILTEIKEGDLKSALSTAVNGKPVLAKHLYRYTQKVEGDFFIQKNLKTFLEQELDYFIKSEVIELENLEPRHITRSKVVGAIGKRIIEFLAQIEEFQKKLWEKKKFVVKTNYVITTNLVPKEFHEEILSNQAQLGEWKGLGFGIPKKDDLGDKHLPVDTKYFPNDFKERILEKLSKSRSLDDIIDGILIRSENFHALQLLLAKYSGKVKCVYIDPPYNTGSDEFLYKDTYQHSSWISMMIDRLDFARQYLDRDGVIFVNIDDIEYANLKQVMRMVFGDVAELPTFVWKKKGTSTNVKGAQVSSLTDYILAFGSSTSINPRITPVSERKYPEHDKQGNYRTTIIEKKHAGAYARETMTFKILGHKPRPGKRWQIGEDLARELEAKGRFFIEDGVVKLKIYDFEDKDTMSANPNLLLEQGSTDSASSLLADMFGKSEIFSNPKPVELLQHLITLSTRDGHDFVLDYFAGSGTTAHAVINLNRPLAEEGRRRYILVEMGDWFESVLLPRLKKAIFCDNWKDGQPTEGKGLSHFIKYHHLEQYEDTIHNVEFPKADAGQKALDVFTKGEEANEYIMKYFLKYETDGSQSLLNLKNFDSPEDYKLRIISNGKGEEAHNVDLIETFNYLLGLRVNSYRFLKANDRKYIIVLGEKTGRKISVVWRPTKDLDLKKDREAIRKAIDDYQPDETYVNGEAFLEGCKAIEPEFKALMGA